MQGWCKAWEICTQDTVSLMLLDGCRKWGAFHRLHLLLRRTAEEETAPKVLEGKPKVHDVTHGHEGDRDDDQQAESLGVGRQNHHDEVQQV